MENLLREFGEPLLATQTEPLLSIVMELGSFRPPPVYPLGETGIPFELNSLMELWV